MEFLPVTLDTGPNPLNVPRPGGKPDRIHVNIKDLEAAHKGQRNWSDPAMRKNRVRGKLRWTIEGAPGGPLVAEEGDIV